jgi:bacillithiol biosynthesis cysteine-adding enzyme BshC
MSSGDSTIAVPLADYPGISPFALDWVSEREKATSLLERPDVAPRPRRRPVPEALSAGLIASNARWGIDARLNVGRWSTGEAMSVIAGQQVGFGGGPLYTFAKIATLLRLRRDLEERHGRPVVSFFWLATEDHDFGEVARITLPADEDPIELRARSRPDSRRVVGDLVVPRELRERLVSEYGPDLSWLTAGITFRDSFARLIREAFGDSIVLVDALLPEVRTTGSPMLRSVLESWSDVQSRLGANAEAIERAGYEPQVKPRSEEPYTLLYHLDDRGERRPVHLNGQSWTIADEAMTTAGLLELLDRDPTRFSTAALTRPLLQDYVLEPDVFVGGPAEVSYYAQLAGLHDAIDAPRPRVMLRGHVLLAPEKLLRGVERHGISPRELFPSPERPLATREAARIEEIRSIAGSAEAALEKEIDRIRAIALPADHSLARSVSRSIEHIRYHFERLCQRAVRAVERKDRERYTAVMRLASALLPGGIPQDRIVAWYPYWRQFGSPLIGHVVEAVEPDAAILKIMGV